MSDLKTGLGQAAAAAFAAAGLPSELGRVTASDRPDLAELDLNPVICSARGAAIADARAVMG